MSFELTDIDILFDFRTDSAGRDPDSASPTLKAYHQALWSKPLPNGQNLYLTTEDCSYLRWGDMYFGSDSITASFRYERNKDLLTGIARAVPSFSDYIEDYLHKAYTIGEDKAFFDLFVDFKGYVDFFFLQDCVDDNYNVKIWFDTPLFEINPMPRTVEEYCSWIDSQLDFVSSRGRSIKDFLTSNESAF